MLGALPEAVYALSIRIYIHPYDIRTCSNTGKCAGRNGQLHRLNTDKKSTCCDKKGTARGLCYFPTHDPDLACAGKLYAGHGPWIDTISRKTVVLAKIQLTATGLLRLRYATVGTYDLRILFLVYYSLVLYSLVLIAVDL